MSTPSARPSDRLNLLAELERLKAERAVDKRALEQKDRELAEREQQISELRATYADLVRYEPSPANKMLIRRLREEAELLGIERANRVHAEAELARARAHIAELEAQLKESK